MLGSRSDAAICHGFAVLSSVGFLVALTTASWPVCFLELFKKIQKILSFLCVAAGLGSGSVAQGSRPVGRHPMGPGPLAFADFLQGDVERMAGIESA